ncbi:MAG: rhodanese-like domain-containing protein [bacterium]|nr:rhodanese-like domain-containing protein [bacterium]
MKQHSSRFLTLVNETRTRINELSPITLKKKIDDQNSFLLIDVREEKEWVTGHIPTAIHLSKGVIERDIEKICPNSDTPIVVYCSGGFRCALVADSLQNMGYTNVNSLESGSQGWVDAGYGLTSL